MNQTTATSTFGPLIAFFAGLLAGKGVFGLDAATWTTIIGSLVAAGTAIWGVVVTRKSNQIAQVAAMPEVQSVKLEPSAPKDLVDATPNNVIK